MEVRKLSNIALLYEMGVRQDILCPSCIRGQLGPTFTLHDIDFPVHVNILCTFESN